MSDRNRTIHSRVYVQSPVTKGGMRQSENSRREYVYSSFRDPATAVDLWVYGDARGWVRNSYTSDSGDYLADSSLCAATSSWTADRVIRLKYFLLTVS